MKYSLAAIMLCAIYLGLLVQIPLFYAYAAADREHQHGTTDTQIITPVPKNSGVLDKQNNQDTNKTNKVTPVSPVLSVSPSPNSTSIPTPTHTPKQQNQTQTTATVINTITPTPNPPVVINQQTTNITPQQPNQAPQTENVITPQIQATQVAKTVTVNPTPEQTTQIVVPVLQKEVIAPSNVVFTNQSTSSENSVPAVNSVSTPQLKQNTEQKLQAVPFLADEITYPVYEYLGIMDGWDRIILLIGLSMTAIGMVLVQPLIFFEALRGAKQKSEEIFTAPSAEDYFYIPKISFPTE